MLKNYFKIIIRNIRRFPVYSMLNISGLAIGMACTFLILLWVRDEISYDRHFEHAGELYRVLEIQYYAGGEIFPVAVTPSALAPALKEEFPEIIRSSRYNRAWWMVQKNDEYIIEQCNAVDPDFLSMFSIELTRGNDSTALTGPHSAVITEEMARKYFGDEDPIGKTLRVNKQDFLTVTGTFKKLPPNTHLDFNILVPFIYLGEMGHDINNWGSNSYYTYVQLSETANPKHVDEKIIDLIKKNNEHSVTEIFLQALPNIHLYSAGKYTADIGGHGDIANVRIFTLVAVFILVIACVNFMNLSTAQSARRAREIGMRKVAGAGKRGLVFQFLGESVFIAFVAHIIAMILVEILLPTFNQLSGKQLGIQYGHPGLYAGLLTLVLTTGLLAGSYPAFFLSSFRPVNVLKGAVTKVPGNSGFRRALVIGQFTLSLFLIISTLVIGSQLDYMRNKKLGLDKDNIGYFYFGGPIKQKRNTVRNELLKDPNIIHASASNQLPTYIGNSTGGWSWEGKDPEEDVLFHMVSVDQDYDDVFRLQIDTGRFFSREHPSDSMGVVINERSAAIIGFDDPIGKFLSIGDIKLTIIGVVRDFHFKSVHTKIEPLIMFMDPRNYNIFYLRLDPGNVQDATESVQKTFKAFDPDAPFSFNFLDKDYENLYRTEIRMGKIFNAFSILAILISCLGLLGLSSFMAERKTREIGVRKANGAKSRNVFLMMSKEFILWVCISFLIAAPLAWVTMHRWLLNFAYRTGIDLWIFGAAGIAGLLIALLTVSWHTWRTARRNPVLSLRYE